MSHSTSNVMVHKAYREDIGDLMTRRPIPAPGLERIGAFLFLNHHGPQIYPPKNGGLPFGPHPHRGFETVTFILDGELAHRDSAGHESVIRKGGVQWMTAGSGLVHSEVSPESFKNKGGPLELLQLWVNLPAALKMVPPAYVGLQQTDIPAIETDRGRVVVNLIAGTWQGKTRPVSSLTGVFMTTVDFQAGGKVIFDRLDGRDMFLYVVRGSLQVNGEIAPEHHLVNLGLVGTIELFADEPCFVLFGHANPIDEPVVARGPFVMNTESEIEAALDDYRAGRFTPS